MKSVGIGFLALACIAALIGDECSGQVTQNGMQVKRNVTTRNNKPTAVNDDEDDFVPYQGERFSVFDWMLFRVMSKKYPGNLLISPVSIKMALVLLYEGAQDQTAYELAGVMQLPASRSAIREKFSTILQSLQETSPAYKLNIGTRMYVDSNILTRQRYEAIVKTFYATDVINTNFSEAHTVTENINSWVSNVTDGHIDKMIDDENTVRESLMIIMNALYFKGSWRRKYFLPENTKMGKFYTSANNTIEVPFMHTINRFYYSESAELDAKILRIPYDGQKFAMYLVLPRNPDSLDQLANDINPFILTRHVWLMQDLPVNLIIPKFKFDFSSHLETILRELGIRDIFDDTATLTGIARARRTSKHLKVSDVLQKTGIEVNENGTVAYAATEIDIGNKIEDLTFHANHPFLFYIEDETTGTIIYVGKIMNPLETTGGTNVSRPEFPSRFGAVVPKAALQPGLNSEDRDNLFNAYFQEVLCEDVQGNVVSSPASVKSALMMILEGAGGNTREELVSALRLPEDEFNIREIAQRTYTTLQRNEMNTEIKWATKLWAHNDLRVLNNYKNALQLYYGGDIESIDFTNSEKAAQTINNWVKLVTHNKVSSSLIDNPSPDTRLVSTSIIYFKGQWLKSFDKSKTRLRCFNVPNEGCKNISFMEHESTYRYAHIHSLDAQVLEIPYSDGKTSMLTFVPTRRNSDPNLRVLSKDLASVPLSAILANMWERDVTIHMPKFSIESKLVLKPYLERLGVHNIFQADANLTKIVKDNPLVVGNIVQNAKIEVDEEGTLAAADTETLYELLSSFGNDFDLDRPFLFMIVDLATNSTIFSGRYIGPN